jgi:predicted ATPase/DNA-binding winged helix-turn-helix (wHTH) protein
MTYRFGDTTVDRRTGQLSRFGRPVPIEPRAFHVLCVLIERASELVDHQTLLDVVWKDVAVTPHSLTEAISQLRRALDDNPRQPRVIETAHRRGYRFIAPLEPIRSGPAIPWRLPGPLVELIGRDDDLATLIAGLQMTRLITLVGPGGVGKTQLGLEAGRRIEETFDDGAMWVDLAPAVTADDVERIVADAIGLPDRRGHEAIGSVLRDTHVLIVLDNCERVAESAGRIASTILAGSRRVQILATSQRPLAATGELLVRVPPLDCPAQGDDPSPSSAVRLFAVRAAAVQPGFTTVGGESTIGEICRRLDGLPLAIELAAAQVRVLSPAQILERLDSRFDLLERVEPAGARYRTLGAMIDWSTSLLGPTEERLLEDVAVFPGAWDLDAAAAVVTDGRDGPSTLKSLTRLVDTSLVLADTNRDIAHYRLLDSVRMFAQSRLARSGRDDQARDRMLHYYVGLAAQADREWYSLRGAYWLDRLHEHIAGVRAVMEWSLATADRATLGLEIAVNLRWFWRAGGYFVEGGRWLDRLLAVASDVPSAFRARAEITIAQLAHHRIDFEAARTSLRAVKSRLTHESSLDLAWALTVEAANEALTGHFEACTELATEAIAIADRLSAPWLRASAELSVGMCDAMRGDHEAAAARMRSAHDDAVRSGDWFLQSYTATNLALQRFLAGDAAGSRSLFASALRLSWRLNNLRAIAGCLEGFGYIATNDGDAQLGARLLGAAARIRDIMGLPLLPQWQGGHDACLQRLDRILGVDEAAREREVGAALPVDALTEQLLTS